MLHKMDAEQIGAILKALNFAAQKHRNQRRKDLAASPYINHPIALANLLWEAGVTDAVAIIGALLHDTVEDTETTFDELRQEFGEPIESVVREVTDDRSLPKDERKQRQIDHAAHISPSAKLIKLADKISNLRDIVASPPANWPIERKQAYFEWAKRVIDRVRGTHPELERIFDAVYVQGIEQWQSGTLPGIASAQPFMLQEIQQQPAVLRTCLDVFSLRPSDPIAQLPRSAVHLPPELRVGIHQIQILACGSSLHASLVGKYLLEEIAHLPTIVRSAPEVCDQPTSPTPGTLVIGVTQSGETADTLTALKLVQAAWLTQFPEVPLPTMGITNQPGSRLIQHVDYGIVAPAGTEVSIAATKTFVAQIMAFYALALDLAESRQTLAPGQRDRLLKGLQQLPSQVEEILQTKISRVQFLAERLATTKSILCLGRGINAPIALEGALKLKETTYIHAEGYHAGEFMHGPIAVLDAGVAVVAIVTPGSTHDTLLSNLQKIRATGAYTIAITPKSDPGTLFDAVLRVPESDELLSPILNVIPLQLLSCAIALHRGIDVDRPRYLTKVITKL